MDFSGFEFSVLFNMHSKFLEKVISGCDIVHSKAMGKLRLAAVKFGL